MPDTEKIDSSLLRILLMQEGDPDFDANDTISVVIEFQGALSEIEALGFQSDADMDGQAFGEVSYADLPAVAAHPNVLWVTIGERPQTNLNIATRDILARASDPSKVGTTAGTHDGLWFANESGAAAFSSVSDASGQDVIIAIIDTGIDYTHPQFMKALTPMKETRILRIWDMGLTPPTRDDGPSTDLLVSNRTYGVEYKEGDINAAIRGGPALLHHDCEGHGTHVAGIAAAGDEVEADGLRRFMGVAPNASIIAVKYLDTPDKIRYKVSDSSPGLGGVVSGETQFRDAIMYCLRVAREEGFPVVINASFGSVAKAGDGLDKRSRWLDARFDPTDLPTPASPRFKNQFPTRACFVTSTGNSGDPDQRRFAKIAVPGAPGSQGQVTVPLWVIASGSGGTAPPTWSTDYSANACALRHRESFLWLSAYFWYRRAVPFDSASIAVRIAGDIEGNGNPRFSDEMPIGGNLWRAFQPRATVPPTVPWIAHRTIRNGSQHKLFVKHETNSAVVHPDGTNPDGSNIRRHRIEVSIHPEKRGPTVTYHEGIYEARITAPAGTEFYLSTSWADSAFLVIGDTLHDGTPIDASVIQVSGEGSAVDCGGGNLVAVASYLDEADASRGLVRHGIETTSSRGPMRDFSKPSGSLPLLAVKPTIAAPGEKVASTRSVDEQWNTFMRSTIGRLPYQIMSGTSMAAPMVAGVVALMLDKNPDLSVPEILAKLTDAGVVRPGVDPAPASADDHRNAYGAGMVNAQGSHRIT